MKSLKISKKIFVLNTAFVILASLVSTKVLLNHVFLVLPLIAAAGLLIAIYAKLHKKYVFNQEDNRLFKLLIIGNIFCLLLAGILYYLVRFSYDIF